MPLLSIIYKLLLVKISKNSDIVDNIFVVLLGKDTKIFDLTKFFILKTINIHKSFVKYFIFFHR